MDIRNCMTCKKLFNYVAGMPVCPACRAALEEKFKEVKQYIRKNPNATIVEVAENNDVDIKQIRQWVREERLIFSQDSAIGIECEACGKSIRTGRFCDDCKKGFVNNLNSAYGTQKEAKEENPFIREKETKMRFLNRDKI